MFKAGNADIVDQPHCSN